MEDKEFKIITTTLVPKALEHVGRSGGFVRLVEILGRMNRNHETKIILLTSDEYYSRQFSENEIEVEIKLMKPFLKFRTLWGLTWKAIFLVLKFLFFYPKNELIGNEKNIFYCSSDLFWDTMPAYYCRQRYQNTRWVQEIYHLYPHWRTRVGYFWSNFFGYYLQKFSLALIKKRADKIFALSDNLKGELVKKGFSERKIAVSYNGLDWGYYQKLIPAAMAHDGVFLGRLNSSKGIYDLIKIWKKVCSEIPAATLAIIGGGNEKTMGDLLEKIKNAKLEKNIKLLGYLENEKAFPILKSTKAFLFPSHEEGWGIAIAEAMACGLPVVSWDLPVYREIFENYIIQVKENNIEKFSNQVIKLLENEELKNRIGSSGREFIKKYSWDEVAENEYQIINNL